MITFAVEPLETFEREGAELFDKHWDEVAINKDVIKLNIDWPQYRVQEAMGAFCGVVARHKGKIIGYWVGFIRPHFHYAESLTAYTDIYFVDKAYRKSGVGADLFKHVEKVLK